MPGVSMSLAKRVGQLFIVGFDGMEITPELRVWMATYGWGGVILFGRNVESPAQVLILTPWVAGGRAGIAVIHLYLLLSIRKGDGWHAFKAPFTAFPSAARVGQGGL